MLEEAASLLTVELPPFDGARSTPRSIPFRLPASFAKGGRSREIRIPVRLLRRLADYADIERANARAKVRRPPSQPLIVVGTSNGTIDLGSDDGVVGTVRVDGLRKNPIFW